jgi:CheY-like chemotaxis protein
MEGDPARIRRILLNLLSNAIKFTPAGWVERRVDWQETMVELAVDASRIGIPADELPLLFQNFVQVDSLTTRLLGGDGPGPGHLPAPGRGDGRDDRLPERAREGFDVSVEAAAVDRNVDQRVVLGLLGKLSLEASVAHNGQEAVEACERERFDLVLMDCQMPVLDGYGATRQILEKLGAVAPPIVALPAHAMESDRAKGLEAGMSGHMTKPVLLEQLRQVINEHTRVRIAG